MDPEAASALIDCVRPLDYDICVITGDYRSWTFGPIEKAMTGMRSLTKALKKPVYAVLGNHDSIRMVPELENMGIHMLLNESFEITHNNRSIYLAGIDDAHYYRVDNIEKSIQNIPLESVSILLSHTPEIYRQAAYAGFDVLFCGHTHGGQICLPGGTAITLDAKLPRYMGARAWKYKHMQGYTSVGAGTCIVNVRLNCHPEVTLHHLTK
jgi:predicted MPP superfamily phosphohydrolase